MCCVLSPEALWIVYLFFKRLSDARLEGGTNITVRFNSVSLESIRARPYESTPFSSGCTCLHCVSIQRYYTLVFLLLFLCYIVLTELYIHRIPRTSCRVLSQILTQLIVTTAQHFSEFMCTVREMFWLHSHESQSALFVQQKAL